MVASHIRGSVMFWGGWKGKDGVMERRESCAEVAQPHDD